MDNPKHLKGLIGLVNKQNPDMVVLTGDFVSYIFEDVASNYWSH